MNSFRREALMDGRRRLVDLSEYLHGILDFVVEEMQWRIVMANVVEC
jgi:hypothetical protein